MARAYPAYLDLVAESLWLLDDGAAKSAADTLAAIGDERAAEILRSFATGRVGSDEARMHAALALPRIEGEPDKEPMTVFRGGKPTPEALIKKALQDDQLYITGRTNLAAIRFSEGKIEEARQLVIPLYARQGVRLTGRKRDESAAGADTRRGEAPDVRHDVTCTGQRKAANPQARDGRSWYGET